MNILDTPRNRENLSMSAPYFVGKMGFVLPPGIPLTSTQKLTTPFEWKVWIILIVAYATSATFGTIFFRRQAFEFAGLIINGSLRQMLTRNAERVLIGPILFAMLILQHAYQGALFDILRAQIQRQPVKTIDDLIKFNYSICSTEGMELLIRDNHPKLSKEK